MYPFYGGDESLILTINTTPDTIHEQLQWQKKTILWVSPQGGHYNKNT